MSDARFSTLEAVLAVAERRSFRAAATQLALSPSALSHTIATLERRLGARLFQRTTRSVGLTPAGEQLVARLGPALREIGSALDGVREHGAAPSGLLRLTTSRGAVHFGLIELLSALRARYPDVEVEVSTQDRLVDIVAEGYDAGIRLAEVVPLDMVSVPLGGPLSMAVVGAPAYFANRPRPRRPADLRQHACIRRRKADGSLYRWELTRRGRELSVEVPGVVTLDDDALALQAAVAGLGLAYVNAEVAAGQLSSGALVRVLEEWTPPFPGLCVFHPSSRLVRPALRAFLDLLKERKSRG